MLSFPVIYTQRTIIVCIFSELSVSLKCVFFLEWKVLKLKTINYKIQINIWGPHNKPFHLICQSDNVMCSVYSYYYFYFPCCRFRLFISHFRIWVWGIDMCTFQINQSCRFEENLLRQTDSPVENFFIGPLTYKVRNWCSTTNYNKQSWSQNYFSFACRR